MDRKIFILIIHILVIYLPLKAQIQNVDLLNAPVDVSTDFMDFANTYYLADSLSNFDPASQEGEIQYQRYEYGTRQAFNNMLAGLNPVPPNEFPGTEYAASPNLPFKVEFVSPRTIRIRATSGPQFASQEPSLMLVNGKVEQDNQSWQYQKVNNGYKYSSQYGSVFIQTYPWKIEIRDADGKLITHTVHNSDHAGKTFTPVMPFCYVRRASDYSRRMAAVFALSPDEKIFGCGESFTQFNKRGQKVVLWTDDANGTQNESMYKPIPFFMSSKGYGLFMHTSAPITYDFGKYFNATYSIMSGDDALDMFIFLGQPKDILDEYTDLTGKAPMPPLWSFGLWMSRITYFSQEEGLQVAKLLRENRVPADVIHFDTGWFGIDWRSDFVFAKDRFKDPEGMIDELKKQGFHISLWQLPYFTPQNRLFDELVEKELVVKDQKGNIPYEDAVVDFSNPDAIAWYQQKIGDLLRQGVGAIKVDFGEAAPANGLYHSGRTGFFEHNLYPLRYNKTIADITRKVTGENIIWARSTWAGSQRYPVHWGGDAANSNTAMAATLRAGLSLGLCGFSFWSHDLGGFVQKAPEDLYKRWTALGMLASHTRSHGAPPKEPWEYGPDFLKAFRDMDEMRYRLMPYIYAQAKHSAENGLPMMRALFIEYPQDPGSWLIDNQYLFGSDIMVAPLLEEERTRAVYLPPGNWIDYQTGKSYTAGWHQIEAVGMPIVMLVKDGAAIPHIQLAQSTMDMDWSELELMVFAEKADTAGGMVFLPTGNQLKRIDLIRQNNQFVLRNNPLKGKTKIKITYHEK